MPGQKDQREQGLERRYKVRQVTGIQASWTEPGRGEEGESTLQLILDNGVEEHILDVDPDAMRPRPLPRLFARSGHVTFDLERKVLMFGALAVE